MTSRANNQELVMLSESIRPSLRRAKSLMDTDNENEREPLLTPSCSCTTYNSPWGQSPLRPHFMFYDSEISDVETNVLNNNHGLKKSEESLKSRNKRQNNNHYSQNIRRPLYRQSLTNIFHKSQYSSISPCPSQEGFQIKGPQESDVSSLYFTSTMAEGSNMAIDREDRPKQGSLITIFSIWNTMVGTSVLAMPWGMERAGLPTGMFIAITMGLICFYTAYCNIDTQKHHGSSTGDIFYLTNQLLGPNMERIAKLFSYLVLLGAVIIYWILMSNFLDFNVSFVHSILVHGTSRFSSISVLDDTVICKKMANATYFNQSSLSELSDIHGFEMSSNLTDAFKLLAGAVGTVAVEHEPTTFERFWNLKTVPIYLILVIGPLLFFKSPTFFTKFNSLGTMAVMYMFIFMIIKASVWGFWNVDFFDKNSTSYAPFVRDSFGAMSGMLSLSYFIHNIIITLIMNNRNQQKNTRDLSIAYVLVMLTYMLIGAIGFISFPKAKPCIEDNFLNNLMGSDPLTLLARVLLFFQLITVYPLIAFMLRTQILYEITGSLSPTYKWITVFNIIIIIICVLFAIFIPRIGTVIRFTGAISGFVHVFTLPCLLRIASLRKRDELRPWSLAIHIFIPILGAINIVLQFFVKDS